MGLVLKRGLKILFWGLSFGLGGVWVSTQIIASLLYGVRPLDLPTLVGGVGLLLLVGLIGALLPSLRGARLSPVAALRAN